MYLYYFHNISYLFGCIITTQRKVFRYKFFIGVTKVIIIILRLDSDTHYTWPCENNGKQLPAAAMGTKGLPDQGAGWEHTVSSCLVKPPPDLEAELGTLVTQPMGVGSLGL